jgi:hypothetical protein
VLLLLCMFLCLTRVQGERGDFFCKVCKESISGMSLPVHLASIAHQFCEQKLPPPAFGIPQHNPGYQMLAGMGWDECSGLGKQQNGTLEPVSTILKADRKGYPFIALSSSARLICSDVCRIGSGRERQRVTHFPSHRGSGPISRASLNAVLPTRPARKISKAERRRRKRNIERLKKSIDRVIRESLQ